MNLVEHAQDHVERRLITLRDSAKKRAANAEFASRDYHYWTGQANAFTQAIDLATSVKKLKEVK